MSKTYKATIQENGVYIIKIFKIQEATTYLHVICDLKKRFVFTTSVKSLEIPLLLFLHLQWLLVPNTKVSFILFLCDIINSNIISQLH
jgi:hypothetical protein